MTVVLLTLSVLGQAAPGSIEVHVAGPAVVALMSGSQVRVVSPVAEGKRGCLLQEIAPGTYDLVASAPGHTSVTQTVTVSDGAETEVSITLVKFTKRDYETRGRIVGFVKDTNGKPIPKAALILLKGDDPVGVARPANATGVYELEWYAPGTYTVVVGAPGYQSRSYPDQQISAGASRRLDVVLEAE